MGTNIDAQPEHRKANLMTVHRSGPRISGATFAEAMARSLPTAVVTRGRGNSVVVEGLTGAYTVGLTSETHEEWETATVEVSLTQPPGFDEPLPEEDAIAVPHGAHSLTSDFGRRLVVNHGVLAREAAQIIKDFEASSPTLSAQATI